MRSIKTDFVFFLVTAIALTLLAYLVYSSLHRIENSRHILKVYSTLAIPLPFSFFISFLTAAKPVIVRPVTTKDIILASVIFISLIFASHFALTIFNHYSPVRFQDKKVTPVFVSTVLTFLYINNYLTARNIYVSGIISGILMGLALFVFLN